MSPHATATTPAACPNCGEPLQDRSPRPPARYCPACGQETDVKAPTVREFMQQFGGAYFSTEGALWRTLRLLLVKPGELTLQYFAGRRKHYVLPLRLYLTISVVALLLLRVAGGGGMVHVEVTPDSPKPGLSANDLTVLEIDEGTGHGIFVGLRGGVFRCTGLPDWTCRRLGKHIDLTGKSFGEQVGEFKDRFLSNLGGAMFLLLPCFALWLKLAYLNRRRRYTEHLVFALHVHAFWFAALALTVPGWAWLSLPAFWAVPIYTLLAMRRVYGGRWGPRLLRALMVSALYGVSLALVLALVAVWSLLS